MTNIQSMMLAVCFGAVVGTLIGNIFANSYIRLAV